MEVDGTVPSFLVGHALKLNPHPLIKVALPIKHLV